MLSIFNLDPVLGYNTTNLLDLLSDNNKEYISLKISYNGKERIKSVNINKNKKDIKPIDIDKKRLATPNQTLWNRLLSELSFYFRKMIFSEAKFLINIQVLDTRYKQLRSQYNNLFYPFNTQLDYILTYYFAKLETTICNIDKFFTNPLIKLIIKKFSYYNTDK